MIAWIIGICVVAVYGQGLVAVVMCIVCVGGPPVARALARKFL